MTTPIDSESDEGAARLLATRAPRRNGHEATKAWRRTVEIKIRLTPPEAAAINAQVAVMGMRSAAGWVAALVRRRVRGSPTFNRSDEVTLFALLIELRRIGVNISQVTLAMTKAASQGQPMDLQQPYLDEMRAEIRGHMRALHEAFEGNLRYWETRS